MVFIKASLGQELRKFSVEKGTTIESLRTTIKEIFPVLSEVETDNLVLLYRDSDDDLITVSSDQELQAALSILDDSATLRLIVRVTQAPRPPQRRAREEEEEEEEGTGFGDLFQALLDPHWFHPAAGGHPFHHGGSSLFGFGGPSWFGRQHALRLHEEKIRQQRLYEEKMRQARLEQMIAMREKAAKEQEELKKKMREERRQSTDLQKVEGQPVIPQFPAGWQVNPFGSWDPLVEEGPNFTRKSWGPYGYVAYFNPSEEKKEEEEGEKEEEKEEEKKTEGEGAADMEATSTE